MGRVRRSGLSREEAKKRYIQLAEKVILEQVEEDARRLDGEDDDRRKAIGPFARLSAERVAELDDGRSRGADHERLQEPARVPARGDGGRLGRSGSARGLDTPDPQGFEDAGAWIEAVATFESERGPMHETESLEGYAAGWVLFLGQVPYGLWSEYIAEPSMKEFRGSAERLERGAIRPALEHFGLEVRPPLTTLDLAAAMQSMIEGLWINQCLTPGTRPARVSRRCTLPGTPCGCSGKERPSRRRPSSRRSYVGASRRPRRASRTQAICARCSASCWSRWCTIHAGETS